MESSTTWMREYSQYLLSGEDGADTRILSTVAYKQAALNCIAYLMKVGFCVLSRTPDILTLPVYLSWATLVNKPVSSQKPSRFQFYLHLISGY